MSEMIWVFDISNCFFVGQSAFATLLFGGEEEARFDGGASQARGKAEFSVFKFGGVEV